MYQGSPRFSVFRALSRSLSIKYKNVLTFAVKVSRNGKYLKREHVNPLLKDLKWINFNSLTVLSGASFMCKNHFVGGDLNVKKINFDLRNKVSLRTT